MKPHKILFSSDFSPCSNDAFQVALDWAAFTGAHLDLIHAVLFIDNYPPNLIAEPEAVYHEMEQAARNRMKDYETACENVSVAYTSYIRKGPEIAETVLAHLKDHAADWLILGTHGRKGLNHFLMGSVAEELMRQAPIPVMTIRADVRRTAASEIDKVMVPIDFSVRCIASAKAALGLMRPGHELHLFHAIEEVNFPIGLDPMMTDPHGQKMLVDLSMQLRDLREQQLKDWAKQHIEPINPGVNLKLTVEMGSTTRAIVNYAKGHDIDLIVMATHGRRGFDHFLLGSITERVFRTAPCPVLGLKPNVAD